MRYDAENIVPVFRACRGCLAEIQAYLRAFRSSSQMQLSQHARRFDGLDGHVQQDTQAFGQGLAILILPCVAHGILCPDRAEQKKCTSNTNLRACANCPWVGVGRHNLI